jgi:hypothetical protein
MCSSSKNNRSMLTCLLAIIHWYCFYVSMQAERAKLESKELIEDAKLRRQVTPMLYFCNKLLAWHFSWPEGSADQPPRSFGCCTKQIIGNQQDFVAINWQNYCLWLVQPEFRPICWVFPHFWAHVRSMSVYIYLLVLLLESNVCEPQIWIPSWFTLFRSSTDACGIWQVLSYLPLILNQWLLNADGNSVKSCPDFTFPWLMCCRD